MSRLLSSLSHALILGCTLLVASISPVLAQTPPTESKTQSVDPQAPLAAPLNKVVRVPLSAIESFSGDRVSSTDAAGRTDAVFLNDGKRFDVPSGKSRLMVLPASTRDIMIGNPNVVDVMVNRQNQVFIVGRNPGNTNIYFLDSAGQVILQAEVQVHVDVATLKDTLDKLVPDHKISVEAVNATIFLAGSVRSDTAAANAMLIARRFVLADENVVSLLAVKEEQQVLLKVKVAEVQKSSLKELGTQLTGTGNTDYKIAGSALTNFFTNTVSFATGTISVGTGIGQLSVALSALERQGLIKTLAEPNLTTVSGEKANLLAGGEYPIPVGETNGAIKIEYKPFGVGLSFIPVIVGPGRISLKLSAEVSAIDTTVTVTVGGSTDVNGLKVRRAETTVEMPSGGSLMIAGMLQNDITETVNGLPYLKDIPILGQLFRSNSFARDESELVVIVSTFIVEPVDNGKLTLPTDKMIPPSDLDMYVFGKLLHTYTDVGPPPSEAVVGPMGYIVK
ncbi:MAG: hypothetical protein A2516_02075 [Alphaproteobacteria bacterium RIFOXYD12_FULL_60_8]|nr:MAG: hypothetical protein A2516_02075 [Alphaproteobacteria bacterium RIFOXYD12_FULL_60_8]